MRFKKTTIIFLLSILINLNLHAEYIIGSQEFKFLPMLKTALSVSNGGYVEDCKALKDGVGMKVVAFNSEYAPNFSNINKALKNAKPGEIVKDLNITNDFAEYKSTFSMVSCSDREVGSEFSKDGKTYLVVDNDTIKDNLDRADTLCTSHVTDMHDLFRSDDEFNLDISTWDTSNVTDMSYMFYYAEEFNQPIGHWNTDKVTKINYIFYCAYKFNQDISKWNLSGVTDMGYMFYHAYDFNQPINDWDTSNVTNMKGLFTVASSFNQPLDKWNVENVTNMGYLLYYAKYYDQNLSNWNVENVTDYTKYDTGDPDWIEEYKPAFN